MIYPFTLSQVAIGLGSILFFVAFTSLVKFEAMRSLWMGFHRNRYLGFFLLGLATAWTIWLLSTIDLMDYTDWRMRLIIIVLIVALLMARYLPDYLSVRALGVLLALGANVLLDAAFLRDEPAKYVVTCFAYFMLIPSTIFVSMPYIFRNAVEWRYARPARARTIYIFISAFGLLLVYLGCFTY